MVDVKTELKQLKCLSATKKTTTYRARKVSVHFNCYTNISKARIVAS